MFFPPVSTSDVARGVTTGLVPLERTSKAFEDLRFPTWRSLTGDPKKWAPHDGRKLRIIPAKSVTVTVGYIEAPSELSSDASTPDTRIPDAHHAYLKYAAAAWLLRLDGDQEDEAKANALMQTFNSLIGANNG